jgi:hypothetical protein
LNATRHSRSGARRTASANSPPSNLSRTACVARPSAACPQRPLTCPIEQAPACVDCYR